MQIQTAGIYLISPEDADAVQRLAADAAVAATTRIPHPYPEGAARDFIAKQMKERLDGSAYVFAIKDRQELVGACGLHGIEGDRARELGYWIGRPFWGRGYASFGVKMVLQFAFQNLRLENVGSCVLETNAASRRVLEKNGFRFLRLEAHDDPLLKAPDERIAVYKISAAQWRDARNAPALATLHPGLKAILSAEIQAGNEIVETGEGWPDRDSVFVRLRQPFRTPASNLPAGVSYLELNDPHWWKAEFNSRSPRHILAC